MNSEPPQHEGLDLTVAPAAVPWDGPEEREDAEREWLRARANGDAPAEPWEYALTRKLRDAA